MRCEKKFSGLFLLAYNNTGREYRRINSSGEQPKCTQKLTSGNGDYASTACKQEKALHRGVYMYNVLRYSLGLRAANSSAESLLSSHLSPECSSAQRIGSAAPGKSKYVSTSVGLILVVELRLSGALCARRVFCVPCCFRCELAGGAADRSRRARTNASNIMRKRRSREESNKRRKASRGRGAGARYDM